MKFVFVLLFSFFLTCSLSLAQNTSQKGLIPLKNGLVISYEMSITQPQNPVLVFLPGVYRGFTSQDDFIKQFSKTNINWVSFHFSLQPESHSLVKRLNPSMVFDSVTLEQLSQEPFIVTQYLKIQKPIFVSLSYSSLITAKWNKANVPWMVEVSPMGRADEQNPGFSSYGQAWEAWMKLVPFWGTIVTNTTKDIAYFNYWTMMVQGLKAAKPELSNPTLFNQTVRGYVKMSKLAEGFDLRKQSFASTPKKIYVIGEKEDAYRLQLQKETILLSQKQTGQASYIFLIKDAGHIIPMDAPKAYLQTLMTIYTGKLPSDKTQAVVSKEGQLQWLR